MSEILFLRLTGNYEWEGDQCVATCKELGISTCGSTFEEAEYNFLEAVEVYLDFLEEDGVLEQELKAMNVETESMILIRANRPFPVNIERLATGPIKMKTILESANPAPMVSEPPTSYASCSQWSKFYGMPICPKTDEKFAASR